MTIPNATLAFKEGQLQIPPDQTDNIIAFVGMCTLGTSNALYSFDGATPADVVSTLGYGQLAQLVANIMTVPGHSKVIAIPAAYTAGVLSSVTATGTSPPTVTLTGNSVDDFAGGRVEILVGGTRGTATFRYALDYDATTGTGSWQGPFTTAATYVLDNSGITLNFATGTYVTDNVYAFTGAAPVHSDAQITAAIDALYAAGTDIGGIYVISTPTGAADTDRATTLATTFAAFTPKLDTFEAVSFRYVWGVLQAGVPVAASSAGLTTWRAALSGATMQVLAHKRVGIAAGMAKQVSVIDQRIYRRNVGWRIVERLASSDISEHLGRVLSGPVRPLLSIEHDEGTTGGLADGSAGQRYLTLRTHSNFTGFYVAESHTFAAVASDYSKFERLRVINRAAKIGRAELAKRIGDSTIADVNTGRILETEAQHIDSEMTTALNEGLVNAPSKSGKGHASSVAARCSRTDDILSSSTFTGQFSVQPLGYFRFINFTIGFTKSNVSAAAA
jgi:hypothetical protein